MKLIFNILSFAVTFGLNAQVTKVSTVKSFDINNSNTKVSKLNSAKMNSNNNNLNIGNQLSKNDTLNSRNLNVGKYDSIPSVDKYIFIDENDIVRSVDTTLTIQSYYNHNIIQKDLFGKISSGNDGKFFNLLDKSNTNISSVPYFGFDTKNPFLTRKEDIYLYNVPTPYSYVTYRNTIEKGQVLDAFITSNLSKRLNVFVGYRGIRSVGNYINELTSIGNFKIGGSFVGFNERYNLTTHFVNQDITNEENSGILEDNLFYENDVNRETIDVRIRNSKSLFKNMRYYLDHSFNIINSKDNNVWLSHNFEYNYFTNLYTQNNAVSLNLNTSYYGDYYSNSVYDKLRYRTYNNKVALSFDNTKLGQFAVYASLFNYNYFFNSIVNQSNAIIPNKLSNDILSLGGSYLLKTKPLDILLSFDKSISEEDITNFNAKTSYSFSKDYHIGINASFQSSLPKMTYRLFQSDFVNYNWNTDFSNEIVSQLNVSFENPFVNLSGAYKIISNKIYLTNTATDLDAFGNIKQLLVKPIQFDGNINYFSIKAQKEFKFGNWALDNVIEYQKAIQDENIMNVPAVISRNTLYYSDYLFKRALFFQAGVQSNYFTKYYMDGYLPLLGEFYVQDQKKFGNYPMIDVFVNMKIQTARIYLALEQVNQLIGKSNHYSAPGYPFRDFTLRLGLTWSFFN